ncbi:helix-turn-helix domain-containing protein [Microbacterium sp. P01]|uniref:helix-turn-helix domain-containing protein n=1 Tax=Microbacterium sp. P01 TaxID=3366261 RepID=UPI00366CA6E3
MNEADTADRTTAATAPLTMTVEETAQMLGQGLRQTYAAVRRGDIPAIKIGARWFVKRPELLRLFGREE